MNEGRVTERPVVQVGSRVRVHRTARGWSMRELARRAGVSQPFITRLEHGDQLPSIPTLYDLAAALEVAPSDLLPVAAGSGTSSGAQAPSSRPNTSAIRLLAGGPGRSLHVHELLIPPAGGDEAFSTHAGEEVAVALEGTVRCLRRGRRAASVAAGDSLTIDPGVPHRWCNETTTVARLLLVCDDGSARHTAAALTD